MIDIKRYLPALVASAALGVASCGEMGDASDSVTVTSELQSFGTWVGPPVGLLLAPPGLARNLFDGEQMTAWGTGTNNQIWVTRQNSSEVWDTGWTQLSNNVGQFATAPPAAVAITLSVGPLKDHYAIVALRNDDHKYYITIRTDVLQTRVNLAIDAALWKLYRDMWSRSGSGKGSGRRKRSPTTSSCA